MEVETSSQSDNDTIDDDDEFDENRDAFTWKKVLLNVCPNFNGKWEDIHKVSKYVNYILDTAHLIIDSDVYQNIAHKIDRLTVNGVSHKKATEITWNKYRQEEQDYLNKVVKDTQGNGGLDSEPNAWRFFIDSTFGGNYMINGEYMKRDKFN